MGISNVQASAVLDDPNRMGGVAPKPVKRSKQAMAGTEMLKLHGRLLDWYNQERQLQAFNRYQMALDEDYYDGLQWSDEDIQELLARGQAPLVFNKIKPVINWLLGTERRTRVDGTVLPREESDEESAQNKTKLLKYLSDVNRLPFARSKAWESCIVAGVGWLEDAVSTDPEDELLMSRFESWRRIHYDSKAIEQDLQDARYLFRDRWVDLDVAIALCPDRESVLRSASVDVDSLSADEDDLYYLGARVNSEQDYSTPSRRNFSGANSVENRRERVKLIEAWYRVPQNCKICRGGDYDGQIYDKNHDGMAQAARDGAVSLASHVRMQVRVALMTESDMLYEGESPYRHNRFPFTPMWCYRRKRDGMPYGVIRDIRDPQDDFNKRASKALYILSTTRVVMDNDAVDDIEELRAEVARPDSIIVKKRGSSLEINQDKALAQEHLNLMDRDAAMIQDVGGVTEQNLGHDDKGLSGKAVGKLQDQGSIVTAPLFDNMRYAVQLQSEIQLSLIEQFYTAPKVVRLVGERKPIEWLKLNQVDATTGEILNDITARAADYVVSEQDFKASMREAMFESMMALIGELPPEVGLQLLDLVVDFADVPNKDELVSRIRKINGQADPTKKPTPEDEQRIQAAQAKQAAAEQMQQEMLQAELDKVKAEAQKAIAESQKISADIQNIVATAVQTGVTAAYEALQAAQIVSTVPNVTPVADAILAGAGYKDQAGQDPNIPAPAGALPEMTPRSDHGDYVGAAPGGQLPELQQADGAQAGIETPSNDGVQSV